MHSFPRTVAGAAGAAGAAWDADAMTVQSTSPRAGGYARGRATREEILDAAMRLFGDVGYHTTSLRDVAARVGISHPGLLHHFPTKAALLEAVLQRRDEVDGKAFDDDVAASGDFLEALARLADRNAARPGIVELYATLSAEATSPAHPAHDYFRARYVRVLAQTTAAFELLAAEGRLRPGLDAPTAGRLSVAGMDGLQVQWLMAADAPEGRVDMARAIRALHASFLV